MTLWRVIANVAVDNDNGHHVMKPIQALRYHDFHDYLASLLSRADWKKQWTNVMRRIDADSR